MNKNRSVATINSPEFVDLRPLDISPQMSACTIKVLYLGENRNGSFISKDVALQMAKTLRGCPIVGYWREEEKDFSGHGEVMTIDDDGIHFSCQTVPYGFVSPVADIWFQKFIDTDAFGNDVEREYLVTQGFLWTEQYPEANIALDGHGQSMELDSKTIDGSWATNSKTGMDFFIINDATFTKLCILGDDVEPCFEGASIQEITTNFSQEQNFTFTLRAMLKELNETLYSKGGLVMPDEYVAVSAKTSAETVKQEIPEQEIEQNEVKEESETVEVIEPVEVEEIEEVSKPEVDNTVIAEEISEDSIDVSTETTLEESTADEVEFSLSEQELAELEELRAYKLAHEKELEELRAYKLAQENAAKDEIINKYHMLTDEDKAAIVEHKEEYSLEQIEEKLALVYVRKNVDFSTVDGLPEKEEEVETSFVFSLDNEIGTADDGDEILNALRTLEN